MSVMKLFPILSRFTLHLQKSYAVDARSLALFRIAVGVVAFFDLVLRHKHADIFYADSGVLPRADAMRTMAEFRWSLLMANGSSEFVTLIFGAGLLAAIAMILGWKTRIATILLWVILVSIQSRNSHLNSGADTLIRVTLLWAMLLPLGSTWSLDRILSKSETSQPLPHRSTIASIATFGLILQLACVYFFTATLKSSPSWREDGTALYLSLGARDVTNSLGNWVFQHAPAVLLQAGTFGTMLLEFGVPILLLLPLRSGWLRLVGVGLIVALHLGIGATMAVGLFPAISIAAALGVLPSAFWELNWARFPGFKSIQNQMQRLKKIDEGNPPTFTGPALAAPGSTQAIVGAVRSEYRSPHSLHFASGIGWGSLDLGKAVTNIIASIMVVVMLCWNVQTVSAYRAPQPVRDIALASGIYQEWSMFTPGPQRVSIWYMALGELESGEYVDVLRPIYVGDLSLRTTVEWNQSDGLAIEDKYWRKYFSSIRGKNTEKQRFAGYICRAWNAENQGENRLQTVYFTRGTSATLPNGERATPDYDQLGSWDCR